MVATTTDAATTRAYVWSWSPATGDAAASYRFDSTSTPPTAMGSPMTGSSRNTAEFTNTMTRSGGRLRSVSTYTPAADRTSRFEDRRATPTTVPSTVVNGIPTAARRSVFLTPTAIASRTG